MATSQIFGQCNDTAIEPGSFNGMSGWFKVPGGWHARMVAGLWQASPNSDFSAPLYACKMNEIGYLVFQDRMLSLMTGC